MANHHRLFAARAHLLELAGEPAEAAKAYAQAARLSTSTPERRYLAIQAKRLSSGVLAEGPPLPHGPPPPGAAVHQPATPSTASLPHRNGRRHHPPTTAQPLTSLLNHSLHTSCTQRVSSLSRSMPVWHWCIPCRRHWPAPAMGACPRITLAVMRPADLGFRHLCWSLRAWAKAGDHPRRLTVGTQIPGPLVSFGHPAG